MERAGAGGDHVRQGCGRVIDLPGEVACSTVAVVPLSAGTAAQIVRYLDAYEIQVSELVPPGERMAVVQHVREAHTTGCRAIACARARAWLTPLPLGLVRSVG